MSTNESYLTPEAIATRCESAKKYGDSWAAKCPSHNDKTASLRIDPGRKATLVYCHAGCRTKDILSALELGNMDRLYHNYDPSSNSNPNSPTSLKLQQMVRDSKAPTMRELAPAQSLEDVLWPILVSDPHTWTWVRIRWADWLRLPFREAMKKWYVVTDAICADLMVNAIDEGYDYTVSEKKRMRDRLEKQWERQRPVTGSFDCPCEGCRRSVPS